MLTLPVQEIQEIPEIPGQCFCVPGYEGHGVFMMSETGIGGMTFRVLVCLLPVPVYCGEPRLGKRGEIIWDSYAFLESLDIAPMLRVGDGSPTDALRVHLEMASQAGRYEAWVSA